jgi:hypothetical protein
MSCSLLIARGGLRGRPKRTGSSATAQLALGAATLMSVANAGAIYAPMARGITVILAVGSAGITYAHANGFNVIAVALCICLLLGETGASLMAARRSYVQQRSGIDPGHETHHPLRRQQWTVEEFGASSRISGAEGATAPETLRPKGPQFDDTLESGGAIDRSRPPKMTRH